MKRTLTTTAAIAVAGVCCGIAVAAVTLPFSGDGNTINGCYSPNSGEMLLLTPKQTSCPKKYEPIEWNVTGPQGDPGSPGTNGTNGISPAVTQLAVDDENCPTGGAAITGADNSIAYVCNGQTGADGDPFSGTFAAGSYSISVTTAGITLSGPNSRKIVLDNTGLTLEDGLFPVTIKGAAVNVEASQNVNIKAAVEFKAEANAVASLRGAAHVTVESSGIAELNGSLVRLGGSCAAGTPVAKLGSMVVDGTVVSGDLHTLVC